MMEHGWSGSAAVEDRSTLAAVQRFIMAQAKQRGWMNYYINQSGSQ
jgi:hypothetical protein